MTARLRRTVRALTSMIISGNYLFSQLWFPTVQLVLQADWQEVWHSPQPPFFTVFCNFFVFKVFTCFMINTSFLFLNSDICSITYFLAYAKYYFKNSTAGARCEWTVTSYICMGNYRFEEDAAPTISPFSQDIAVGIYADLSINVAELLK